MNTACILIACLIYIQLIMHIPCGIQSVFNIKSSFVIARTIVSTKTAATKHKSAKATYRATKKNHILYIKVEMSENGVTFAFKCEINCNLRPT